MNVKDLLRDDDAVSPVIGVILMVAITVILAAVIGTFVLGLGDQVQSSAPNANFQFEYNDVELESNGDAATFTTVTIQHNGGQDVEASNINILVAGSEAYDFQEEGSTPGDDIASADEAFDSGTLSTGSSDRIVFYNTGSDEVATGSGTNNIGINTGGPSFTDQQSGDSIAPTQLGGGETVRVVWTSPNGDSSNTIGSSTVPN